MPHSLDNYYHKAKDCMEINVYRDKHFFFGYGTVCIIAYYQGLFLRGFVDVVLFTLSIKERV